MGYSTTFLHHTSRPSDPGGAGLTRRQLRERLSALNRNASATPSFPDATASRSLEVITVWRGRRFFYSVIKHVRRYSCSDCPGEKVSLIYTGNSHGVFHNFEWLPIRSMCLIASLDGGSTRKRCAAS